MIFFMIKLCSISVIYFSRFIFAMMLVDNEMNKSIHSCGQVQAIPFDVNQKLYLTVNQNHITNYYPPGSQPLVTRILHELKARLKL